MALPKHIQSIHDALRQDPETRFVKGIPNETFRKVKASFMPTLQAEQQALSERQAADQARFDEILAGRRAATGGQQVSQGLSGAFQTPSLNNTLSLEDTRALTQDIAQKQFETARAPLEAAFKEQRTQREEELASRGVSLGGLGAQSRERLFRAQDEILGRLQGQIQASALERAFTASEAAKSREFAAGQQRQAQQLGLASAGQLKGTALDTALSGLGISAGDFLTAEGARKEAAASQMGVSIEEFDAARQFLGEKLIEDIRLNPERYAGLAEDPQKVFEMEKEIAKASRPKRDKFLGIF